MVEIVTQAHLLVGILAVSFVGPAMAIAFLVLQKRRARARRRSPIGFQLLRGPGHTIREQLEETRIDVYSDLFILTAIPLMVLSVFLAQAHLRGGVQAMTHLAPAYVAVVVVFVAYMLRRVWYAGDRLDRLKAGLDGEVAVGQELDQLMRQGAVVFHDVPACNFNIDHVVVSTAGVIAIETKGFTKPKRGGGRDDASVMFDGNVLKFPTWVTKKPLEQALRQAEWLAKWLSEAVGEQIQVLPVLALPGWYVERSGRGQVRVYSGKELAGLLRARGASPLSESDVRRVAHQLEQRCRTVSPRLAEGGPAA